jgi:hypothetical protein
MVVYSLQREGYHKHLTRSSIMDAHKIVKKAAKENPPVPPPFEEAAKEYVKSHPEIAEYFRLIDSTFGVFGRYLSLTQSRLIIQEMAGGSNAEAEINAPVSPANS